VVLINLELNENIRDIEIREDNIKFDIECWSSNVQFTSCSTNIPDSSPLYIILDWSLIALSSSGNFFSASSSTVITDSSICTIDVEYELEGR